MRGHRASKFDSKPQISGRSLDNYIDKAKREPPRKGGRARGKQASALELPIESEALSNSDETKALLWRESCKATGVHFLE